MSLSLLFLFFSTWLFHYKKTSRYALQITSLLQDGKSRTPSFSHKKEKHDTNSKKFHNHFQLIATIYLTKVSAHSWAVWFVTCSKLSWCRFSLSSADIFRAWSIEAATSVIFQGFTRIAPAPRDCAAPANYKNAKKNDNMWQNEKASLTKGKERDTDKLLNKKINANISSAASIFIGALRNEAYK